MPHNDPSLQPCVSKLLFLSCLILHDGIISCYLQLNLDFFSFFSFYFLFKVAYIRETGFHAGPLKIFYIIIIHLLLSYSKYEIYKHIIYTPFIHYRFQIKVTL